MEIFNSYLNKSCTRMKRTGKYIKKMYMKEVEKMKENSSETATEEELFTNNKGNEIHKISIEVDAGKQCYA